MACVLPVILSDFAKFLEHSLGAVVDLRINQNRKTMLSVLERRDRYIRLSIHQMFLEAPNDVLEALAIFIQSHERRPPKIIQSYIHKHLEGQKIIPVSSKERITRGRFYNLDEEWAIVNESYFNGRINVSLGWFGKKQPKSRTRVTLGMFDKLQNQIKVHVLLDSPEIPRYYLQFVLYHEALHKIYPPYLDDQGNLKVHHDVFKRHEKRFKEYNLARHFEQSNKKYWFASEV